MLLAPPARRRDRRKNYSLSSLASISRHWPSPTFITAAEVLFFFSPVAGQDDTFSRLLILVLDLSCELLLVAVSCSCELLLIAVGSRVTAADSCSLFSRELLLIAVGLKCSSPQDFSELDNIRRRILKSRSDCLISRGREPEPA